MVKFRWEMDEIDDCVIVTRVVDSGEVAEDKTPILRVNRISRPDAFAGIAEIRSSLDLLEKELKNAETPKPTEKPKK